MLWAGYLDERLAASWTFNGKDEATVLSDTAGNFRFTRLSYGNDKRFERTGNGTVFLGAADILSCDFAEKNTELKERLRRNITVWMRVRFPEKTKMSGLFFQGFLNSGKESAVDWEDLKAGIVFIPEGGACFYNGEIERYQAGIRTAVEPGRFYDLAFTFDSSTGIQAFYLNGEYRQKKNTGKLLPDFTRFSLGRIRKAGGLPMEVDEVRIYDVTMTEQEIASLKPVPKSGKRLSESVRGKFIVEDFADISIWRAFLHKGGLPGKWFPFDYGIGGEPDPVRSDGFSGKVYFHFGPQGGTVSFRRHRVTGAGAVAADAVEYDIDTRNIPCRIAWGLRDAKGKTFQTDFKEVQSEKYVTVHHELSKKTVNKWNELVPPVRLWSMVLQTAHPGKGYVNIDDIRLCGEFSRKQAVRIFPVYAPLARTPNAPFILKYRLSNNTNEPLSGSFRSILFDFELGKRNEAKQEVRLRPQERKIVEIAVPALPPGSYHTENSFEGENVHGEYNDFIAVFRPNGARINRQGMKFGIMDTGDGAYEGSLHREWMRLLGLDVVRFFTTGNRIEQEKTDSFASLASWLGEFRKNGIDVCFTYSHSIPSHILAPRRKGRRMPSDWKLFREHMERLFRFLKQQPNVKYFEWWNEADIDLGEEDTAEDYVKSLKIVFETARRHAPEIKVLTSGVTTGNRREKKNFSRDMYVKGKGFYDIAAFHGHGSVSSYRNAQERVEGWLGEAGLENFPAANTETGERSGYTVGSMNSHASLIVKKVIFAKTRNTEFYTQFTLQDFWDLDPEADDSFGCITCDNRPKPALPAYNEVIRQLANTKKGERFAPGPGLEAYRFETFDGGEEVWVLWPVVAGERQLLMLSGRGSVTLFDMFGKSEKIESKGDSLAVVLPGYPAYIRMAGRRFAAVPPPVQNIDIPGAVPNSKIQVRLRLSNQEKSPVEFEIETLVKKLAAGESVVVSLPVQIPEAPASDMISVFLNVKLRKGNEVLEYRHPVSVSLGVPVRRETEPCDPIRIDEQKYVHEKNFDPKTPRWAGKKDLSGLVRVSWNRDELTVQAEITDNVHVQTQIPEFAWRDDCIQIGLAGPNKKHYEFTVSGGVPDRKNAVYCHIAPDKKEIGEWNVPVSVVRKGDRTFYQLKLPLSKFGITPVPGSSFRMSFLISDNDGLGKMRYMEWGGGIGRGKNMDEFNWMILQ